MATTFETALRVAEALPRQDQLRLAKALENESKPVSEGVSILDLAGLGREIWEGLDAQEYVRQERNAWRG